MVDAFLITEKLFTFSVERAYAECLVTIFL